MDEVQIVREALKSVRDHATGVGGSFHRQKDVTEGHDGRRVVRSAFCDVQSEGEGGVPHPEPHRRLRQGGGHPVIFRREPQRRLEGVEGLHRSPLSLQRDAQPAPAVDRVRL